MTLYAYDDDQAYATWRDVDETAHDWSVRNTARADSNPPRHAHLWNGVWYRPRLRTRAVCVKVDE